jgi:hypothetical protein
MIMPFEHGPFTIIMSSLPDALPGNNFAEK